ncbi:YvrJ family protein [Halobacillus litoralis]|uniref:YvrJ family protein n=1 Tax=Halobacillus litoralis TaxID=45668 RepID=A0A410MJL8_9BACI|nr:YvrJ family protein [Halobacillus litoralis]QAS54868.1 YvrJ family protein [Halobacillus litoralis]
MTPDNWLDLISNLGFPVVVTFYLLFRLEKSFQKLEESVDELLNKHSKCLEARYLDN